MSYRVLRIEHDRSLPHRAARDAELRKRLGSLIIIERWTPPENPAQIFELLQERLLRLDVAAIEIDTVDRIIAALIGLAVSMQAVPPTIPVLFPSYKCDGKRYPICDMREGASATFVVPEAASFAGYLQLTDAVPHLISPR